MSTLKKATIIVLILLFSFTSVAFGQKVVLEWYDDAAWHEAGHDAVSKLAESKIEIGIKSVMFSDTSTYQTQMRMALASSNAPALFDWWFAYRMKDLVDAKLVADVTPIWKKHIASGEYPASLMNSFGFKGRAYAIPKMIDYWVMFYNTKVFTNLGLTIPKTWDNLMSICQKVKGAGITPINASAIGWPSFIWFEELLVRTDTDLYVKLMEGKVAYNDPKVIEVVKTWKDMIDKGYFSDPGISGEMLDKAFAQGKAAMTLMGSWYASVLKREGLAIKDFGIFVVPGLTSKGKSSIIIEARPILIGAKSKQRVQAEKFADFFMGVEAQTAFAKALEINSPNLLVSNDTRPEYLRTLAEDMTKGNYKTYTRFWEATPPEIVEQVVELLGKFMVQPSQYKEILDEAAQVANKYWEKNR